MKNRLLIFISTILFIQFVNSQIVTTDPVIFTQNSGSVDVIFDASLGTKGLMDFNGDVYAHTGVVSNLGNWLYAPTWGDNSAKYKLVPLGNNKWKLTIGPTIEEYYGTKSGEKVKQLAFVFRSADKTKEGKADGGQDIFIDVYEDGFNVAFSNPNKDKVATLNSTENIQITASQTANLELLINGNSVKTVNSTKTLDYSYTYSQAIDYQLVAKATAGNEVKYDTVNVCVPAAVVSEPRPSGLKNGISYSADGKQATLILHAPNKQNVFVIGDFNNWVQRNAYQMKKDGEYWWITINDLTPKKLYRFQYLVDNTIRITDPYTELVLDPWNDKWINEKRVIYPNIPEYPEGKTTGLVATLQSNKDDYNWEVKNFKIEHPENLVIYELLLRDFTPERTLEAAIDKLDYLKELGVTAIELLPIQEFDGNDSWGYNPSLFFAPDKAYGTPEMYKKFIDECHKRDMAVILDMVFNHATGNSPFAMLFWDGSKNRPATNNPWMNPTAPHQFSVFNDFNHSYKPTREYFKDVLRYWLEEYKVDGYRMDLTKGFTQNSGTEGKFDQSRVDYLKEYYQSVIETNPDALFILEHFVGGSEETTLASEGMYLWRNINHAYSEAAMGWANEANFNGMNSSPRRWVGYAESHDEERIFFKAKTYGNGVVKTDSIVRIGRVPLVIAFSVLTPGPKMIWQFGELGFDYSIDDFGGRTNAKPPAFTWLNLPHRKKAYEQSAKAINLKRKFPKVFTEGSYKLNVGSSDWTAGKRISVTHSDLNMVMLGNFDANTTITATPNFQHTGTWYELISGDVIDVSSTSMTISMNPGELRIYTNKKVDDNSIVDDNNVDSEFHIYPNIVDDKIWIKSSSDITSINIYDTKGSRLIERSNTKEIDVSELSSGIYIITYENEETTKQERFIKR